MANRIMLNETSYHGAGAIEEIANEAKAHDFKKAFVCSDPDLIKFGVTKKVTDVLDKNGLAYEIYSDIKANPTIENVQHGVEAFKKSGADYLIAIGGGSSMDTSKAIGIIIANPEFEDVRSLEGVAPTKKPCVPIIAVPTTAGTAAEVTINYVITDVEKKRKFVCVDTHDIPVVAVIDPDMMASMPKGLTAATGMDALTHAVEAYCNRFCSPKMKAHAKKAVRLIGANLLTAYREPENKEARMNMLAGSYEAGIAFTNAYVGYVHAIAHGIGGLYHVPHGEANAILLPKVLAAYGSAVYTPLARLEREVRTSVAEDESREETDAVLAEAFIERIRRMNRSMGISEELAMLRKEDVPELAARALKEGNPNYPVPVIWEEEQMRVFLMEQVPK